MKSKQDLNAVITRVINSKIKPNVFIKPWLYLEKKHILVWTRIM
jgi:hypothetical protein